MAHRVVPAVLTTLALGACIARAPHRPGGDAAVVPGYTATRWVPPHPTFAVTAQHLGAAQRALPDLLDAARAVTGFDRRDVSASLGRVLGFDPLGSDNAHGVGAAGIDLAGGAALFSEDLDPTLVLHVAHPDRAAAALAPHQAGLAPQTVDGVAVYTAPLTGAHLSWALDGEWLWLHVAVDGGAAHPGDWLAHSRVGGGAAAPSWRRAMGSGAPALIAVLDPQALAAAALARAPGALGACAQRLASISGVAASAELTDRGVAARVALDLGPAAAGVAAALLPPPPGWSAASAGAPLAAQWNLDLAAATGWLGACAPSGDLLARVRASGVRAARAVLASFEDELTFTGGLSLDLSDAHLVTSQLDQIPLRSHLERDRTFGPYAGHHLSIPTLFAIDYVVTPTVALLARGDGLLERLVAGPRAPATAPATVAAIDVTPGALTGAQWQTLAHLADAPGLVPVLTALRALHMGATLEGTQLVIEASAERR